MAGELVNSYVGDYRLVELLGVGGMGEVYRGVHQRIGRVVAVKFLTQISDAVLVQRFLNEARIQSRLHHPNIAMLHDFLEVRGHPCIIMEYVDGQTLRDYVDASGKLVTAEAIRIFQDVVAAIAYMHDHGIIHRDIKTANIKISASGEVKLLDFGIAKSEYSPRLTRVGDIIGTPLYLSPEQIGGRPADRRGDVWALGVLLYVLITGKSPYGTNNFAELIKLIPSGAVIPPETYAAGIPRQAAAIIGRCLRLNPEQRYPSAADLLQDVRSVAGDRPLFQRFFGAFHKRKDGPTETPAVGEVIKAYWPAGLSVGIILILIALMLLHGR